MNKKITESYRRYVLSLLFLVYSLNFLDRQLMSILLEPIKLEFLLTDTEMGILTGIAFAFLYTTLAFPIARWADRGDRVLIISASLFIWSLFTTLTGLVTGHAQLLCTRIFVGIGEAGCSPAAYSIISDYYPKERRGKAISIYSLGIPIGIFLGFIMGGLVAQNYGWRAAFFVAGVPGIILAFVLKKTVINLPRGHADDLKETLGQPPFLQSIKSILSTRSFLFASLGAGIISIVGYGLSTFLAAFMIRSHGLNVATAGICLGTAYIFGAGGGIFMGGSLVDRFATKTGKPQYYLWIPMIGTTLSIPVGLTIFFLKDLTWIFIFIILSNFLATIYWAPIASLTQRLTRLKERAMGVAILFFMTNFIGLGLGPFFVGFLSHLYKEWFIQSGMESVLANGEGLRYSLITLVPLSFIGVFLFYLASRRLKTDPP